MEIDILTNFMQYNMFIYFNKVYKYIGLILEVNESLYRLN